MVLLQIMIDTINSSRGSSDVVSHKGIVFFIIIGLVVIFLIIQPRIKKAYEKNKEEEAEKKRLEYLNDFIKKHKAKGPIQKSSEQVSIETPLKGKTTSLKQNENLATENKEYKNNQISKQSVKEPFVIYNKQTTGIQPKTKKVETEKSNFRTVQEEDLISNVSKSNLKENKYILSEDEDEELNEATMPALMNKYLEEDAEKYQPKTTNHRLKYQENNKNETTETHVTIESKPEEKQNQLKRIGYLPTKLKNIANSQQFPLVAVPRMACGIMFPRKGRSNKKGFKEDDFNSYLTTYFSAYFKLHTDRHLPVKGQGLPYEPDFVLYTEKAGKNIFIDIEIDEPYDGFSRIPTHEIGKDELRNEFFIKRGWIVIRFAEIQIHKEPLKCCSFIAQLVNRIDPDFSIPDGLNENNNLSTVECWSSFQAKQWSKKKYRENYLGIKSFGKRTSIDYEYNYEKSELDELLEDEIENTKEVEIKFSDENKVDKLTLENPDDRDKRITFYAHKHRYFIDGNPDTISVSELLDKFFPEFDAEYWSKRKALERGIKPTEILAEWEEKRVNSANLGTKLHSEIENYYNQKDYDGSSPEFKHFIKFTEAYPTMTPYRTEWRIFEEELLIAGTVDMVYQKSNGELYMFDWKRSEKVVDKNGEIKAPAYDFASGELSHLADNSYNRYALQQNIYKYILEKRYNKTISSINLLILHPNFGKYHVVKLPDLSKEVRYIFEIAKTL